MTERRPWTVERCLWVIAGSFVIASVVLGHLFSPWWYAFTVFVGLNMVQSAFTGWCPMMTILRLLGVPDAASCTTAGHSPRS